MNVSSRVACSRMILLPGGMTHCRPGNWPPLKMGRKWAAAPDAVARLTRPDGRTGDAAAADCALPYRPIRGALDRRIGASPSGKAAVFGTAIPRFESWRPSQPRMAGRALTQGHGTSLD